MHKIFIIEDDLTIAQENQRTPGGLELRSKNRLGFPETFLKEFVAFDPHLILLDISLPFFNGLLLVARRSAKFPRCR